MTIEPLGTVRRVTTGARDLLLVGDVGGTKTSLAIVSAAGGPRAMVAMRTFRSVEFPDLTTLVKAYLSAVDLAPTAACFGVPGPVVDDVANLTNLPWTVDRQEITAGLGLRRTILLNDVQATAAAVPHLRPTELHTLQTGKLAKGGAIAVIAPGTGVGQAFLTWDGARYHAHPSEGGHSHFSPLTSDDASLWSFLRNRYGRVSAERVCSGSGIPNVYAYLLQTGHHKTPDWFASALAASDDPTATIVKAALDSDRSCPLCQETLQVFVRCLAAESGNLALKVLATGGVYLGGGIPPRIVKVLEQPTFLDSFRSMGRYTTLLARMPIHVILSPQAALLGAAYVGLEATG